MTCIPRPGSTRFAVTIAVFFFLLCLLGAYPSNTVADTQDITVKTRTRTDAKVYWDNCQLGETLFSGTQISAGSQCIQMKKSGFETYRKTIAASTGQSGSLEAYLISQAPSTGRLYVDIFPSDAKVKILNISQRFYQGIVLQPGSYNVEVFAGGYEKQTRTVSVCAGEDRRVDFRLSAVTVSRPPASGGSQITNSLGMTFVYIEPGSFMMGSLPNEFGQENSEPRHRVTLTSGYYMQTTEVTQGQWQAVMGNNPSYFKGEDLPVELVSWNDVQTFIHKLNQREGGGRYRLPTEAEWEYACRAGSSSRFCFGDSESLLGNYAWYRSNSDSKTHGVGQKQPNAWGLFDMHGSVWEWCHDWFGKYPSASVTDPEGPSSGSFRVVRGGSWGDPAWLFDSVSRRPDVPGYSDRILGFRLSRIR